jgi:hypothetical protein
VTARSYAPVLTKLAPRLAADSDCVRLDVVVEDGRAAIDRMVHTGADVWIPDDQSWTAVAGAAKLAEPEEGGAGTTAVVVGRRWPAW